MQTRLTARRAHLSHATRAAIRPGGPQLPGAAELVVEDHGLHPRLLEPPDAERGDLHILMPACQENN